MISVTGIGSWPGSDVREATVTTRDLLLDADGLGLPYLPETPARGPGSDLLGRAAGLLVDLHRISTRPPPRTTATPAR